MKTYQDWKEDQNEEHQLAEALLLQALLVESGITTSALAQTFDHTGSVRIDPTLVNRLKPLIANMDKKGYEPIQILQLLLYAGISALNSENKSSITPTEVIDSLQSMRELSPDATTEESVTNEVNIMPTSLKRAGRVGAKSISKIFSNLFSGAAGGLLSTRQGRIDLLMRIIEEMRKLGLTPMEALSAARQAARRLDKDTPQAQPQT